MWSWTPPYSLAQPFKCGYGSGSGNGSGAIALLDNFKWERYRV
jgi:hypothetical protein